MAAGSVVVDLDVLEQMVTQLLVGHQGLVTDGLHLQAVEEALGWRIVPAIPAAAHAGDQVMLIQQRASAA